MYGRNDGISEHDEGMNERSEEMSGCGGEPLRSCDGGGEWVANEGMNGRSGGDGWVRRGDAWDAMTERMSATEGRFGLATALTRRLFDGCMTGN